MAVALASDFTTVLQHRWALELLESVVDMAGGATDHATSDDLIHLLGLAAAVSATVVGAGGCWPCAPVLGRSSCRPPNASRTPGMSPGGSRWPTGSPLKWRPTFRRTPRGLAVRPWWYAASAPSNVAPTPIATSLGRTELERCRRTKERDGALVAVFLLVAADPIGNRDVVAPELATLGDGWSWIAQLQLKRCPSPTTCWTGTSSPPR